MGTIIRFLQALKMLQYATDSGEFLEFNYMKANEENRLYIP